MNVRSRSTLRVVLCQSSALVHKDKGNSPRCSSDDIAQRRTRLQQEHYLAQQILEAFLHAARFTNFRMPASLWRPVCVLTGQHQPGKQGHDCAWAWAILQQAGPRLSHIAAGWTNHVLAACGDAVLAALVRLAANREQAAIAQQDLRAPTRAVRRTSLLTSQTPQGLPTEPAVRQVPAICHQRQHALSDLSVTQPLLQQTGTFGCAQ